METKKGSPGTFLTVSNFKLLSSSVRRPPENTGGHAVTAKNARLVFLSLPHRLHTLRAERNRFQTARSCFCWIVFDFEDDTAKTCDWSFGVSRKSEIRNFSAVAAPGSSLKIPDIVFFEIHPKSGVGTFGRAVYIFFAEEGKFCLS